MPLTPAQVKNGVRISEYFGRPGRDEQGPLQQRQRRVDRPAQIAATLS